MQRPSVVTIVLLAAALALAGNMATNTVQVSSGWWPYLIWTLVVLLVLATVLVELRRVRDAVDVVRVSRLTDPIKLGVHPAASVDSSRVPPFIARDRLPDVENALRTGGFVLVVGDSTAGKTRLAYEAMRRVLPRHLLIRPRTPDALLAAMALARRKKRAVLWLDDLERFLGFTDLPAASCSRPCARTSAATSATATIPAAPPANARPRAQAATCSTWCRSRSAWTACGPPPNCPARRSRRTHASCRRWRAPPVTALPS